MKKIVQMFNKAARNYDQERKKVIPHLDLFYQITASLAYTESNSPNILDLGAGTGLLSSYLLTKYPKANIILIDFSEKMLDIAKLRFKGNPNIKYIVGDYSRYNFNQPFDIIVSALSIHHLKDKEKFEFYKKCFTLLKIGGIFINADLILGNTLYLETLYKDNWKAHIKSNLSKEQLVEYYKKMELDKEATLNTQLSWLKSAGFSDIDCVYKYYNFVVLFARKL